MIVLIWQFLYTYLNISDGIGDRLAVTMRKLKLTIIATTVMIILCLSSQFAQVSASAGYQDEFTESTLQSYWTFINESGTSSYSLTTNTGYLRITAPAGARLSPGNTNAPRVLQTVTGDFVATTNVSGTFSSNLRAGLLIWQNTNNFMRLEKQGTTSVLMYGNVSGSIKSPPSNTTASCNNICLKYERIGSTVTGYYSTNNGASWLRCTNFTFSGTLQIGLVVLNTATSSLSADFDYFRISPNSNVIIATPEYPMGILGVSIAIAGGWIFFKAKNTKAALTI